MPVITLSRQFGAGGAAIGRALADRFGAAYLDREILAIVAERSGIPEAEAEGYDEQLPGLWQRLASALATSAPEVAVPSVPLEGLPSAAMGERLPGAGGGRAGGGGGGGSGGGGGGGGPPAAGGGGGPLFPRPARPGVLRVQLH